MRILIIGCGQIGRALATMLSDQGGMDIVIADIGQPEIKNLGFRVNFESRDYFEEKIPEKQHFDYVFNTAPVYDPKKVGAFVQFCIDAETHYLDICEDIAVNKEVRRLGKEQDRILVAPGCGLAPGLINILSTHVGQDLDECQELDLRVGALTRSVGNALGYLCTWSPEGLVNEYLNDSEVVIDGVKQTINPFVNALVNSARTKSNYYYGTPLDADLPTYLSPVIIDGIRYESFPTSGGVGYLNGSYNAKNIMYRSIRYPGHFDHVVHLLSQHSIENRAAIVQQFHRAEGVPDVVLVFARATGTKDGIPVERQIALKAIQKNGLSAIQKATAGSVAAISHMHARDQIKNGLCLQENVLWSKFVTSAYYTKIGFEEV